MFDGGWRYEEAASGKGPVEDPKKDGFYDHIGDSVVYLPWNIRRRIWDGTIGADDTPLPEDGVDHVAIKAKKQIANRRAGAGSKFGVGPAAHHLLD